MNERPPEDQPDVIYVGPVGPIPVFHDDDPRLEEDRTAWSMARAVAQALHSVDDLLIGLTDQDWRVRHEVVDRLIARGGSDPRTVPALVIAVERDDSWQVRDAVVMRLHEFDPATVRPVLLRALEDDHEEVRQSARHSLAQLGM